MTMSCNSFKLDDKKEEEILKISEKIDKAKEGPMRT